MKESNDFIPTRQSLLSRLKDWNDQDSWKEFFDIYWKLIYSAAIRAGLTDVEAQDAVQETVISVMKAMPGSEYDATKSSFKKWLLQLTKWRIVDQFRKRQREIDHKQHNRSTSTETGVLERLPDPAGQVLDAMWEEEWEKNLLDAAVDRVKRKVDPKQYQVFDLYVLKNWPVAKVARTLEVSRGLVYLTKHRVGNLIKKEITYLQSKTHA